MRNLLLWVAVLAGLMAIGCGSGGGEPEGYKADNFAKKPVPPGFGPKDAGPPTTPSSTGK